MNEDEIQLKQLASILIQMFKPLISPYVNGVLGTNAYGQGLLDIVNGKSLGYAATSNLISERMSGLTSRGVSEVTDRLSNNYLINSLMLTGMTRDAAKSHLADGGIGLKTLRYGANMLASTQLGGAHSRLYENIASRTHNYREFQAYDYMDSWRRSIGQVQDAYESGEFGNSSLSDIFNVTSELVKTGRYDGLGNVNARADRIKADLKQMMSGITRLQDVMGVELPEVFEKIEKLTGTSLAVLGQSGVANTIARNVQNAFMFSGVNAEEWAHYAGLQYMHNRGIGTQEMSTNQGLLVAMQSKGPVYRGVDKTKVIGIQQEKALKSTEWATEIETLREALGGRSDEDIKNYIQSHRLNTLDSLMSENQRLLGNSYGLIRNSNLITTRAGTASTVNLANDMEWMTSEQRAMSTRQGRELTNIFGNRAFRMSDDELYEQGVKLGLSREKIFDLISNRDEAVSAAGIVGETGNTAASAFQGAYEARVKRQRGEILSSVFDDNMWRGRVTTASISGLLGRLGQHMSKGNLRDIIQSFLGFGTTDAAKIAEEARRGAISANYISTLNKYGGVEYMHAYQALNDTDRERYQITTEELRDIDSAEGLTDDQRDEMRRGLFTKRANMLKAYLLVSSGKQWQDLTTAQRDDYRNFIELAYQKSHITQSTYDSVMWGLDNQQLIGINNKDEQQKQALEDAALGSRYKKIVDKYAVDSSAYDKVLAAHVENTVRQIPGWDQMSPAQKERVYERAKEYNKTLLSKAGWYDPSKITYKGKDISLDRALLEISKDLKDDGELTADSVTAKRDIINRVTAGEIKAFRESKEYLSMSEDKRSIKEKTIAAQVERDIESAVGPDAMSGVVMFIKQILEELLGIRREIEGVKTGVNNRGGK